MEDEHFPMLENSPNCEKPGDVYIMQLENQVTHEESQAVTDSVQNSQFFIVEVEDLQYSKSCGVRFTINQETMLQSNVIVDFVDTDQSILTQTEINNTQMKAQDSAVATCSDSQDSEIHFQCSLCNYKSDNKSNLTQHKVTKHTNMKLYKCKSCEYSTVDRSNLSKHTKKHNTEKPYKCESCDYQTTYSASLSKHTLSVHSDEKRYMCESCGYRTALKGNLSQHIVSKHQEEKLFKCVNCDYRAALKYNLLQHIKLKHNEERPFECELCDYKAKLKRVLSQHVKLRHEKAQLRQT